MGWSRGGRLRRREALPDGDRSAHQPPHGLRFARSCTFWACSDVVWPYVIPPSTSARRIQRRTDSPVTPKSIAVSTMLTSPRRAAVTTSAIEDANATASNFMREDWEVNPRMLGLVRTVRKCFGVKYPYVWQHAFWLAVRRLKVSEGDATRSVRASARATVLVVEREEESGWRRSGSHGVQQRAIVANVLSALPGTHPVMLSAGRSLTIRISDLKAAVEAGQVHVALILDPLSVGGVGLIGLAKAHRVGSLLAHHRVPVIVVSWDALDPQQAAITRLLSRPGRSIALSLGSDPVVCRFMAFPPIVIGPVPEVALGQDEIQVMRTSPPLGQRRFDVYVPSVGDQGRDLVVKRFVEACKRHGLTVRSGLPAEDFSDYVGALTECRAAFVVNRIRSSFSRFSAMRAVPTKHHLVGRNAEALVAGCVLLAESCRELQALGPLESVIEWSDPEVAAAALCKALTDVPRWSAAVERDQQRVQHLITEQARLRAAVRTLLS